MPITTVKSSMSFPEAGQIRKGAPKEKREKNGRAYETVGKDLGQAVRFVVFEGRDSAFIAAKLLDLYGLTSTKPILCMLPFAHVSDCWEVYNECYTGGRMVARADGERYIRFVNPATGTVEVDEGEPYRPYNGERSIEYDNKEGKHFVLPVKPVGKLKVFLPELERFVWFTVKTTSYYDAINLEAQLSAIQGLADTLNNGSCAGIRFYLYRMQKDVTWNKPDGTASRVPKWLLNVEVDPEWVKAAVARLSQFALTGQGTAAGLLPATIGTISGTTDPDDDDDHDEAGTPPPPEEFDTKEYNQTIITGEWATETTSTISDLDPEFPPVLTPLDSDELTWARGVIYTLPSTKGYQGKALAQIEKYDPDAIDFLAGEKFLPSTEEGILFKRAAMIIQKARK